MPEGTEIAQSTPLTAPGEVQVRRALLSVSDKTRDRRVRARARRAGRRARVDGRHRRGARRRGHPAPLDHRLHRASRRSWTGASRRCTRSSTPACSRCATTRRTSRPRRSRHRDGRPRVREPLPVRADRRQARRARRRGDREHRHRRADDDPRGGEELRLRRAGRLARQLRRGPRRAARRRAAGCRSPRASRSPPRRSPTPPATTRRSRAGSPRSATTSRRCSCARSRRSPTSPTARTRTSAPPTTRRSARRAHLLSNVRQLHGKPLSFNNLLDLDAARACSSREFERSGLRDRQAQQPVRRGARRRAARRLRAGVRVRPASRVRRRDRPQPAGRRPARRGARASSSSRCCSRRATRRRRSRRSRASRTCASSRTSEQQALNLAEPDLKQVVGGLLVQDRDLGTQERAEMRSSTQREPTDEEWGELLFAWRVCKHVRSNAIVLARGRRTVGIGAGQMSRVDSVRIAVEKAREGLAGGRRARLRRLLPVRRRPAARDRRRRHRDHPAGRLGARRRGHRGGRRGRRRDGLHEPAALPALSARTRDLAGVRLACHLLEARADSNPRAQKVDGEKDRSLLHHEHDD